MKLRKSIFAILMIAVLSLSTVISIVPPIEAEAATMPEYNVLYIGNSKTFYNSVPALVNNLGKKKKIKLHWTAITYEARYLDRHYIELNKANTNNIKANAKYKSALKKIKTNKYDVVVIQEQTKTASTRYNDYRDGAYHLIEFLKSTRCINKSTPIVINSIWGEYEEKTTNISNGKLYKTKWENFKTQNETINTNSNKVKNYLIRKNVVKKVYVANCGLAFNKFLSDRESSIHNATERYNVAHKLMRLTATDQRHSSVNGSYLEACVLLQAIGKALGHNITFNKNETVKYDGTVKHAVVSLCDSNSDSYTKNLIGRPGKTYSVTPKAAETLQRVSNGFVDK